MHQSLKIILQKYLFITVIWLNVQCVIYLGQLLVVLIMKLIFKSVKHSHSKHNETRTVWTRT